MKRVLIAGVLLTAASVVAATTMASAGQTVYAPKDCTKPKVQPKGITIACADAGIYLQGLNWENWGGHRSSGAGTLRVNNCKPSCIEGTTKSYDSNVSLTNAKRTECGGRKVLMYDRIHLRFPNKKPPGAKDLRSEKLSCNA